MDSQKEQYLEKILYLRNNLALLDNSQELNQAHYQRLWNEHTDLLGLVLVPDNHGRDDLEMRLNTLRRNIVTLATSVGVQLQPFQPQGLADALAAQPQQFWNADGRPPQPHFSPSQESPAGEDIGQHLGEELSYLVDVREDSPPRRQRQGARMPSRRGDVGSQLNPIPLESDEECEAGTPWRTSTLSGRQTRLIQPRPNQRSNTTQGQRHSSSGKQAPDDGQPRRRSQTEGGGAGPVRRASNSSLRKTPYPLNPPSFSQAPPNLVQNTYPPSPHYKPSALSFSPGPLNPTQQPYSSHPHYRSIAPAFPQAPQNSMPLAQQRQASITLLTTGEAYLPNPVVCPQETPREQFTQHWDGVLNQIAGGLAMRGENPAGAARRLALYNQQYPRERASAMAPPAPLTAFQRNQNRGASLQEGASEAENEFFVPMSPWPYEKDEDGTLSGRPAPPPSGPYDSSTGNAPSPGPPAQPMSGNYDASIYDAPSPGPVAPPPSGPFDYPTHSEPSPTPPAPHPSEPFDASIYDASPPANAVVSSPIRGGELPPAPLNPGPATLTPADHLAASYFSTETPGSHGLNRQQQQQQQQQDAADAAAAAAIGAVEAAASPSNSIPGNWDASSFEYDGDGHTEPN